MTGRAPQGTSGRSGPGAGVPRNRTVPSIPRAGGPREPWVTRSLLNFARALVRSRARGLRRLRAEERRIDRFLREGRRHGEARIEDQSRGVVIHRAADGYRGMLDGRRLLSGIGKETADRKAGWRQLSPGRRAAPPGALPQVPSARRAYALLACHLRRRTTAGVSDRRRDDLTPDAAVGRAGTLRLARPRLAWNHDERLTDLEIATIRVERRGRPGRGPEGRPSASRAIADRAHEPDADARAEDTVRRERLERSVPLLRARCARARKRCLHRRNQCRAR